MHLFSAAVQAQRHAGSVRGVCHHTVATSDKGAATTCRRHTASTGKLQVPSDDTQCHLHSHLCICKLSRLLAVSDTPGELEPCPVLTAQTSAARPYAVVPAPEQQLVLLAVDPAAVLQSGTAKQVWGADNSRTVWQLDKTPVIGNCTRPGSAALAFSHIVSCLHAGGSTASGGCG